MKDQISALIDTKRFVISELNGNHRIALQREHWDAKKGDVGEIICELSEIYKKLKFANFEGWKPQFSLGYRRPDDQQWVAFPTVWLNKGAAPARGDTAALKKEIVGELGGMLKELLAQALRPQQEAPAETPQETEGPF